MLPAIVTYLVYCTGLRFWVLAHVPSALWLWAFQALRRRRPSTRRLIAAGGRQLRRRLCSRRCISHRAPKEPHRQVSEPAPAAAHPPNSAAADTLEIDAVAEGNVREGSLVTRDGTRISYYILDAEAEGAPLMLLCNGVGAPQFRVFKPIIMRFGRRFTYITWDYRGLFRSERPTSIRRLAVSEHAHDAAEVMAACGREHADVLVGWSMGVQVGLEFALLYPSQVRRLVLMNGAHGQVFHSAFQPIMRLPIVHELARAVVAYAAAHPGILRLAKKVALPLMPTVVRLYVKVLGSRLLKDVRMFGERYVEATLTNFLNQLTSDEKTMATYLWLFQELDAHSVYHLLGCIEQEALLISGLFDLLLPAYHMWEMERRMPHAVHVCDRWSAHFTLLEHPEVVLQHLASALRRWGLLETRAAGSRAPEANATKHVGTPS